MASTAHACWDKGTLRAPRVSTHPIAAVSNNVCAGDFWLQELDVPLTHSSKPFVYVNVGANKGYNIAAMLQIFGNATFSNEHWHSELLHYVHKNGLPVRQRAGKTGYTCGVCLSCMDTFARRHVARSVDIHAFEIVPDLFSWLKWACAHFGIPASLVHAAVSGNSGIAMIPTNFVPFFGYEATRLWRTGTAYKVSPIR